MGIYTKSGHCSEQTDQRGIIDKPSTWPETNARPGQGRKGTKKQYNVKLKEMA